MMVHTCHAIGCDIEVPPKMLMCYLHWRMVPYKLKRNVWATYVEGQEIRKDPTPEYIEAMTEAIISVGVKEGKCECPSVKHGHHPRTGPDGLHCECWYDGDACCNCGAPEMTDK